LSGSRPSRSVARLAAPGNASANNAATRNEPKNQ
jgi:hypothetical protein